MSQVCTWIVRTHIHLAVFVVIALIPLCSEAGDFDGIWSGTVFRSIASAGGVPCRDTVVNVLIDGPQIKGTAAFTDDSSNGFTISGSLAPDGTIANGSFAVGDTVAATFTGSFSTASASGSWTDISGCFGTFRLDLAASYVHEAAPSGAPDIRKGFNELWAGNAVNTVTFDSFGDLCGTADLIFNVRNVSIVGSVETNGGWGMVPSYR